MTKPGHRIQGSVEPSVTPDALDRVNILGVGISAVDMGLALKAIESWIAHRNPTYVCITPVHSVMLCHDDKHLRAIYNRAGLTTPDGMPLVWLCRLKGHREVNRVYGPDLMLALCERSVAKGYSHLLYGGATGVPEQLSQVLQAKHPGLQVRGAYSPPYRPLTPDEDSAIIDMINAANPDVVWVGLGAPKQERWMAEHRDKLTAPVLIGVGAAFDFHTGLKKQAPYWTQRSGLEWLFRLLSEPQRLWKRYVYSNPRFVALVLLQALGLRRFSMIADQPTHSQ